MKCGEYSNPTPTRQQQGNTNRNKSLLLYNAILLMTILLWTVHINLVNGTSDKSRKVGKFSHTHIINCTSVIMV